MSLLENWKEQVSLQRSKDDSNKFWTGYLAAETKNYEYLLEHKDEVISGKLADLAAMFGMDTETFTGFLEGINTSLVTEINLEEATEDTEISLQTDFEKLYSNMLDAKADWLYNLSQWDGILSEQRRSEIKKEYNLSKMAVSTKVGRNDQCPCGSGKKYKKCCGMGKAG